MNPTKTESEQVPAKLRWYQYRLRTLLLLFPLVAMVTAWWVSFERLPYNQTFRRGDTVISTSRFVIIAKGTGGSANGTGSFQVGGLAWDAGGEIARVNGKVVFDESHSYAWGTLNFQINGAHFSLRRHAREVVANGRRYNIKYSAVITIDQQGNITVEDRAPLLEPPICHSCTGLLSVWLATGWKSVLRTGKSWPRRRPPLGGVARGWIVGCLVDRTFGSEPKHVARIVLLTLRVTHALTRSVRST
jgi:hypothetical protein